MAWSPLPGLFRPRVQRVCAAWRSWGQQGPATGQPRVSGTGVRPSADPPERPPRQAAGSGSPRVNSGSFSSPRAPQNPLSNGFQSMSSKARGAEDPWASGRCAELLAGPYEQWIRERGRGWTQAGLVSARPPTGAAVGACQASRPLWGTEGTLPQGRSLGSGHRPSGSQSWMADEALSRVHVWEPSGSELRVTRPERW